MSQGWPWVQLWQGRLGRVLCPRAPQAPQEVLEHKRCSSLGHAACGFIQGVCKGMLSDTALCPDPKLKALG